MASNPMQRKVRNSFLLGVLTMLLVAILIGMLVFFLVIKPYNDRKKAEEAARGVETWTYVLNQDVKSGDIITPGMLTEIQLYENLIPSSYVDPSLLQTMQLQDEDGHMVYCVYQTNETDKTKQQVLYINIKDNQLYKTIDNKTEHQDYVLIEKNDTGYYKTLKMNNEKEYIKLTSAPTIAKVDLKANTILTTSVIAKSDEISTDSLRYVEYNMITIPVTLNIGDYIDIRLRLPNGQDLIVVSKKEIKNLIGQTTGMNLTEQEILILNSAIVEAYLMTGSELYMASYVEPGLQAAATNTYMPTNEVITLINMDENIVNTARQGLAVLYSNQGAIDVRNQLNSTTSQYNEEAKSNIQAGMQQQIQAAKAARENYLQELNSY